MVRRGFNCADGADIHALTAAVAFFGIYFIAGLVGIGYGNFEKAGKRAGAAALTLIFINIISHTLTSRCGRHNPHFFAGFERPAFFIAFFAADIHNGIVVFNRLGLHE